MSEDERVVGQKHVEATIAEMMHGREVQSDAPVAWHHDFDRDVWILEVSSRGEKHRWKISGEDLADYATDRSVRRRVDGQLRMYVIPQKT
ncbi:MAG TPA: hypothetical protein VEJ46_11870 [Candidatus Acidoferrum sp.]|nr:hypothetical protein [Candidatus Acidoferrum sp.]